MKELEKTESVCPICYRNGKINKIDASIIEEDGKVWITKECKNHGFFRDIYFGDINLYNRWMRYKVEGETASYVKTGLFDDPPLYDEHKSQTVLTNLIITNRCNLRCRHCSMNAGVVSYVYEPTLNQIRQMLIQARIERPVGSRAINITGGEPTLREDLFEIIKMTYKLGFFHIQVNTNGLKLAESMEYCRRLKDEKVNAVYMGFDGVTKKTNPQIDQCKKAIENLRRVNLKIVLVSTLIGDENVHESGKIIRFALDNMDIVRGVNFQPMTFCSRTTKIREEKREPKRVDYVQIMEVIEKEFDGQISRDDFYPASFLFPISKLMKIVKGEIKTEFTAHPICGGVTYIFLDHGKPLPVTRFIDVEGLLNFVNQQADKKGSFKKLRIAAMFVKNFDSFVDKEKALKGFDLIKLLKDAAIRGSYESLQGVSYKSLFVGSMWFQDVGNLDIDRLKRCVVHYTTPEGIIPVCMYDGLGYGEKICEKHSISVEEWERQTGRKLEDDLTIGFIRK